MSGGALQKCGSLQKCIDEHVICPGGLAQGHGFVGSSKGLSVPTLIEAESHTDLALRSPATTRSKPLANPFPRRAPCSRLCDLGSAFVFPAPTS